MSETLLPPPTLTIELVPVVMFNGGEYNQLVLREPKVDERRQAEEQLRGGNAPHQQTLYQVHLVAKVAGVPVPVVQQIGVSTLNRAMVYLSGFLFGGLETGEASAQN